MGDGPFAGKVRRSRARLPGFTLGAIRETVGRNTPRADKMRAWFTDKFWNEEQFKGMAKKTRSAFAVYYTAPRRLSWTAWIWAQTSSDPCSTRRSASAAPKTLGRSKRRSCATSASSWRHTATLRRSRNATGTCSEPCACLRSPALRHTSASTRRTNRHVETSQTFRQGSLRQLWSR